MAYKNDDEKFMIRCLELAEKGRGRVSPNPMVGAVVVHDGKIIGEGYHRNYGGPHAEVHAIESVKEKHLLPKATIYVNLEPCAHFGKTPPCSLLIREAGIRRIVIGCRDSYKEVDGKGIQMLKDAGREVITGVLEKESRALNVRFFTFHEKKRPYVILKWAVTKDGYIDKIRSDNSEPAPWITNSLCRIWVHRQRAQEDAVLIGTQTARNDNPGLTVRNWSGNNPIRVVTDRRGILPANLQIFDNKAKTLILGSGNKPNACTISYENENAEEISNLLYQENIHSVIVEGGSRLLQNFIDNDLWDEAWCFTGNITFGNGIKGPTYNEQPEEKMEIGDSLLEIFRR